ncbi:MAG: hypothetical protein CME69_03540 [Halobacteriovorax sp.]|nr:hypothetical protein [Halobacteriovorax sp.]
MSYDSVKLEKLEKLAAQKSASSLKVEDIMDKKFPVLKENYSIKSSIEILRVHKLSGAPIVSDTEVLKGVITEFDLLIQASTSDVHERIKFNENVITLGPDASIKDALKIILSKKLKIIPIVDKHNKVLGLMTRINLLNTLIQY